MGVIINNNDSQSDLQKRITSDLREKQEKRTVSGGKNKIEPTSDFAKPQTDFVVDSAYMHDFAKSSVPGWVWALGLIVAIVIAALVASAVSSGSGLR